MIEPTGHDPSAPPGAPPSRDAPAVARTRRLPRWIVAIAAVALLAAWAAGDLLVSAARAVGQQVAGVGSLEWESAAGWVPISRADARRRDWPSGTAFLAPAWAPLAAGLETADLSLHRPPNPLVVRIFLARIDPGAWRFRVWGRPDFRGDAVGELAAEAGLALAVNASYFAAEGPLGLVVSDGAWRGRQGRNRAAHFLVGATDPAPFILNGKGAKLPALAQGFQGFPAIMSAGRTFGYMRFGGRGFDVRKVDRRTAACTLRDGRVVLLVTDTITNGLSLDELATVLGGLGCTDAMGFDGGSSTGMTLRVPGHARTIENLAPVPVIVGIQAR
jgi:hypothetical protein